MNCELAQEWIWGSRHPSDAPPDEVHSHLAKCRVCDAELEARRSLTGRLRLLRSEDAADTPPGLDRLILDAAAATSSVAGGDDFGNLRDEVEDQFSDGIGAKLTDEMHALLSGEFSALDEDIADDIVEGIARDYGEEIAFLSSSRLSVHNGDPPATLPESPRAIRAAAGDPIVAPVPSPWRAPRASVSWLAAATAMIFAAIAFGFVLGRMSLG